MAATTREDEGANGGRRYVAERNGQDGALLHPGVVAGVNSQIWLVASPGNVESAQDVELVLEDREATGQNGYAPRGQGAATVADGVGNGVVTEDASSSRGLEPAAEPPTQ